MHWRAMWDALFGAGAWGTGGNLVAAAILGALSAAVAWLGRHRIRALWRRHHPHSAEIAEIRQIARSAHRIMADLYEHHTGERHLDSPDDPGRNGQIR